MSLILVIMTIIMDSNKICIVGKGSPVAQTKALVGHGDQNELVFVKVY